MCDAHKDSVFRSEKISFFFSSKALVGGVGGNFGFSYMRFIFLLNLFYFLQLLQNKEKIIRECQKSLYFRSF